MSITKMIDVNIVSGTPRDSGVAEPGQSHISRGVNELMTHQKTVKIEF